MSVDHYENFPVASILCPRALRPAVRAIYAYARTADDLADEGDAPAGERLAALRAYRDDLRAVADGGTASPRWRGVFDALAPVIRRHALPLNLLEDLLDAFAQDTTRHNYAHRAELLDYCRRSANPVGRLLLHLYGVHTPQALRRSDDICTALQLANFWQDLGIDTGRGRLYVPQSDLDRLGVQRDTLINDADDPGARRLMAELVDWTRQIMWRGAPLALELRGRVGWELRLVVHGGLRILQRIDAMPHTTLHDRPVLRWHDAPRMLWNALTMRATVALTSGQPT